MAKTVAVSGKGGTGKSTFATLLLEGLLAAGEKPILAVDADPNSTFGLMLGVAPERAIGDIREDMVDRKTQLSPGVPKNIIIEQEINECLVEATGFDLITMGRPEGPGCYCYVNMLLRKYLDGLSRSYCFVIMDNEAGMEHLSRRTTRDVDHLFVMSDPTYLGVRTAARIIDIAHKLGGRIRKMHLVINGAGAEELSGAVRELLRTLDVAKTWFLPSSPEIQRVSTNGEKLLGEGIVLEGMAEIVNEVRGEIDG